MNNETPRPPLSIVPPQEPEPVPDYSNTSRLGLFGAEAVQMTRLLSADVGHFFVQYAVFAHQVFDLLRGEDVMLDWDPDVRGMRPDLDAKQQNAHEHLQAIWQEISLRRSKRQNPH